MRFLDYASAIILDLLVGYLLFYVPLMNFHLYADVTITGKELQNLGLCSALRAFEQGGIFIVPYGTSVFPVSFEGPPHSVVSYDTQRENLFLPGFFKYGYILILEN
jgi:hypothetical protein